jgi:HlyD family secretion protein
VTDVANDVTIDEEYHQIFYKVKVALDQDEMKKLKDVHLVSGMPAEVFIDTGSRSLFQYMVQPLIDSFHRAFRET